MTWYEVYLKDIEKKGNINNYVKDKIKHKKKLINLIKKYSKNRKVLEAGCGTGVVSTYMASIGYNVTAIDIDDQILKLSKYVSKIYNANKKPSFENKSIFLLNFNKEEFDVSFSNGVLEHFDDDQIVNTLKQQMRISKYVIFGIPTKYFSKEESMYGDERYLDFKYWRHLIHEANGVIVEEESMHYLGIIGRIKKFRKYFKPMPFRIFVIKNK